jgi:replicative DNA helicase
MTAVLEETPSVTSTTTTYDFDDKFQAKIAALALRDTVFAQRTDGLVKPEYLTLDADRFLVSIVIDYYGKYGKAPHPSAIKTLVTDAFLAKKVRTDMQKSVLRRVLELNKVDLTDREFVTDKVAAFARQRAVEEAMIGSMAALEKGDYAKIEKLMGQALTVGINEDASEYDYFKMIEARTEHRKAVALGTIKPDGITTGYPEIDKLLYHGGWGRKELSALMAPAKWGKSMGLGDFGKNAAVAGHPTLICSCEVSANIYADRLDANFTETAMKALKDKPYDVMKKIKEIEAKSAPLIIHDFAAGTLKPSMLRRMLERYRARGVIFDVIAVDYADIMAPEHYTGDAIQDSKNIWINLRAIAHEQSAAVLTATQTNREGAKKMTSEATDVAEDFNKIRIADLVIAGNATKEEKAIGEARLSFAASRNQEEMTITIKQSRECMKFLTKVLRVEK